MQKICNDNMNKIKCSYNEVNNAILQFNQMNKNNLNILKNYQSKI